MDHLLIRKPLNSENVIKYADGIDWAIFCTNADLRLVSADALEEVEDCLFLDSLANNVTITHEIAKRFRSKMDYSILIRNATYFSSIADDGEVRRLFEILKADNFTKYLSIAITQRSMLDKEFFDFIIRVYQEKKLNNMANNPITLFLHLLLSDFEKKNMGFIVSSDKKNEVRNKGCKLFISLYKDDKNQLEFKQRVRSAIYNLKFNNNNWLRMDVLSDEVKKIVLELEK